jgi:hypothetical protein
MKIGNPTRAASDRARQINRLRVVEVRVPASLAKPHSQSKPTLKSSRWRCSVSWSRLSEQLFRVDKWSVCRG